MKTQTEVIVLSPDQLIEHITVAIIPILERLEAVEKKLLTEKLCYTANEIGDLLSVSGRMIRIWITEGKVDPKGKLRFLKAVELMNGKYTIKLADAKEFMTFFQ